MSCVHLNQKLYVEKGKETASSGVGQVGGIRYRDIVRMVLKSIMRSFSGLGR